MVGDECWKAIFGDGLAGFGHESLVVRQVVDRDQHWSEHLVRLEQVPQIAAAMSAGGAGAGGIQRFAILGMLLVA